MLIVLLVVPGVGPWVVLVLPGAGPVVRPDVGLGVWLVGIVAVVVRVPGVRAELRADVRLCGRRVVVLCEAFVGFFVGFVFIGFVVIVVIGSGSSQVTLAGRRADPPEAEGVRLR